MTVNVEAVTWVLMAKIFACHLCLRVGSGSEGAGGVGWLR